MIRHPEPARGGRVGDVHALGVAGGVFNPRSEGKRGSGWQNRMAAPLGSGRQAIDLFDLPLGRRDRLGALSGTERDALGADNGHVGDPEEAEYDA